MTDHANELRRYSRKIGHPAGDVPSVMLAAADEIERLAARLEAAEKTNKEWLRANAPGGWIDNLRAKIEAAEQQEPVGQFIQHPSNGLWEQDGYGDNPDARPLYALPGTQNVPDFADAYQGAMEEVAIWKKRALEAEDLNRKFIAEINGPTHMGEPAHPAPSVPTALLVAVANLVAQMEIVSRVGFVDTPNDKDSCAAFCIAEGTWLELVSAVESLASALEAAPEAKP